MRAANVFNGPFQTRQKITRMDFDRATDRSDYVTAFGANDEAIKSLTLRILHLAAEGERASARLLEYAKHMDSAAAA